jgi:hypothetical protein
LIPPVGGTPLPTAKMPACTAALVAVTVPAGAVVAKLKPQTLSVTLKRP